MRTLNIFKARTRGFTLIELLVVIAIIALLASIILASLNTARSKARDARRLADLKEIQTALELYANDHGGSYPAATTEVAATTLTVLTSSTTQYIPAIPDDPLAPNQHYQYITTASPYSHYCVGGQLEGTPPSPASTCSAVTLPSPINYSLGD